MNDSLGQKNKLKIAIIAPPWLSTFERCYFGIENVIHNLTIQLVKQGHHVELFTVGPTTTAASKLHWFHKKAQYSHIHKPYYHTASIIISHILFALQIIKNSDFDIIHDHNNFIGPGMMSYLDPAFPPVLHTLHQPFTNDKLVNKGIPDNRLMFEQLSLADNIYFNPISKRQFHSAPNKLRKKLTKIIYNGIEVSDYLYSSKKKDYFLSAGSIKHDKGQAVAARFCKIQNQKLKIAGIIAGCIHTTAGLKKELNNPSSKLVHNDDFKYYKNEVMPHIVPGKIDFIGVINGAKKLKMLSEAKALLMPIQWDEPFGIIVLESLASGTPVVAFDKGAMSEIISHGKNGFLARSEAEFQRYMKLVDTIDPVDCRKSVMRKFSAEKMAENYAQLYKKIIDLKR